MAGYYDVAQICLNGHLITDRADSAPQHGQKHCDKCGAETTTACGKCKTDIRGDYHHPDIMVVGSEAMSPPSFCHECGAPYPWTQAALSAARELAAELENLKPEERKALAGTLEDLVADTPRSSVAALRFKKLATKAGREAGQALRNILHGVATDAVRGMIWGG